jgi:predicted GNAT family N-acyltransferase
MGELSEEMIIKRFRSTDAELFLQARRIREAVFVREQQVPTELEYENEEVSVHYLLFEVGEARATGRWRRTEKGIKLERFAVPVAHRGKGYGTILLKRVLKEVLHDHCEVYLHAQLTAVDYYRKAGFRVIGPTFEEAGIIHHRMVYRPSVGTDE